MEENNNEKTTGYTGEYGNPVEGGQAPEDSTYSYSYKDGNAEATHSGDYYGGQTASSKTEESQDTMSQASGTEQTEQSSGQNYQHYYQQPQQPQQQPGKKNSGNHTARKLLICAACAVVFGIVAGVCFEGVRFVSERIFDRGTAVSGTKLGTTTNTSVATGGAVTARGGNTDVSGIVEQTMPAIVAITSTTQGANYYDLFGQEYQGEDTTSSGSGFIVGQNSKELLIATNNHVIQDAKTISVQFIDEEVYEASVKGSDTANDLAVVAVQISDIKKSTMEKIKIADLGDSNSLKVGEMAIAIGNALGYGQSVTVGYISAKDREISESSENGQTGNTIKAIQTDAAINPGNSGGALLNTHGQVIGINSAKIADSAVEGVGYAIPISVATPIIDELMNKETLKDSDKGYLGISGRTVTEEMSVYNMPNGVYVAETAKGGAAEKAGIKQGDIITAINNMEVRTIESLQEKANSYRKGTEVEITVQRSNEGVYKEETFKVELQGSESLDNLEDSSQSGNSGSQNNNGNDGNSGSGDGSQGFGFGDFGDFFGN